MTDIQWIATAVVVYSGSAVLLAVVVRLARWFRRPAAVPSHSPEYQVALRSAHWRWVKRQVRIRARNRCEAPFCRRWRRLSVHHLTYVDLGHETLDQVRLLCPKHHARADAQRRRRAA